MHPNSVDLHAGLYGVVPAPEEVDIGNNVVISATYAHFMAPFMMAFSPAPPGRPHPAPWKAAKGGLGFDITTELFSPATTQIEELDRINTIWWIVALLRLRATSSITVPVISSERFSSIPAIPQEPEFWPMEIHTPRLFPDDPKVRSIDAPELEWLRRHWLDAAPLLKNEDFYFAFEAVDTSIWNRSPALALITVWAALERLFSPSSIELSFRTSANIAAYLEAPEASRYSLFKKIKALYDVRSKAAHGSGEVDLLSYFDTYAIAKRVLMRIIETRHVPSKKELEANLFSHPVAIAAGSKSVS